MVERLIIIGLRCIKRHAIALHVKELASMTSEVGCTSTVQPSLLQMEL